MMIVGERLYFVVLDLRPGADDFTIEGIYSTELDAVCFRDCLNGAPGSLKCAAVDQMQMEQIKDALFKERLATLAPLVNKVLEQHK